MPVPVVRSYECGGWSHIRKMGSIAGGGTGWDGLQVILASSWAVIVNEKEDG